jgi:lysozyme family protein|tara:strand:+ start:2055 stop:2567 length:513 start_codon:yes stop_codon:yes gene_type:complete
VASENYEKCLETILHHEGGYVNHPKDPGGETNLGVTKRVYEEWGGTKDMKDLTFEDVAPIYRKNYWDRLKGDDLPKGLDLCVFDFGVNAGTGRSAKYLQNLIGTTADGGIGPNTLKAVNNYVDEVGLESAVKNFQEARQGYYERLKTFETFGRGWTRRVTETTELATKLI